MSTHPTLLCLHGWGGSGDSFTELRQALAGTSLHIESPDLPGFGREPEPATPWTTDDFASWVEDWVRARGLDRRPLLLLGHSHGGRIALKLTARGGIPLQHLFLCASAGIRHRRLKHVIGLILSKTGNAVLSLPGTDAVRGTAKRLLYKILREHDYERASPTMQQTLILVTREDLRTILPLITVPTDIFWGTDDRMTPLSDGVLMHRLIPGSILHTFPGVRHRVHRDRAMEIARAILPFAS